MPARRRDKGELYGDEKITPQDACWGRVRMERHINAGSCGACYRVRIFYTTELVIPRNHRLQREIMKLLV